MDTQYLTKRGGTWHTDFVLPASLSHLLPCRRVRLSLHTADFKVAASVRDKYIRPLLAEGAADTFLRLLVRTLAASEEETRAKLDDLLARFDLQGAIAGVDQRGTTLRGLADRYLAHLRAARAIHQGPPAKGEQERAEEMFDQLPVERVGELLAQMMGEADREDVKCQRSGGRSSRDFYLRALLPTVRRRPPGHSPGSPPGCLPRKGPYLDSGRAGHVGRGHSGSTAPAGCLPGSCLQEMLAHGDTIRTRRRARRPSVLRGRGSAARWR